jgi:hypothetical protein
MSWLAQHEGPLRDVASPFLRPALELSAKITYMMHERIEAEHGTHVSHRVWLRGGGSWAIQGKSASRKPPIISWLHGALCCASRPAAPCLRPWSRPPPEYTTHTARPNLHTHGSESPCALSRWRQGQGPFAPRAATQLHGALCHVSPHDCLRLGAALVAHHLQSTRCSQPTTEIHTKVSHRVPSRGGGRGKGRSRRAGHPSPAGYTTQLHGALCQVAQPTASALGPPSGHITYRVLATQPTTEIHTESE